MFILAIALLLIIMGIMIKYFKCYWLISGYNTASQEEKQSIDIEKLGEFVGSCTMIIGILMGGAYYLFSFKQNSFGIISICLILLLIGYMLVYSQQYYKDKRKARKNKVIALVLVICLYAFLGVVLIVSSKEVRICIENDKLFVSGVFGMNVPLKDITAVELKKDMPMIERKISGTNTFSQLKGKFQLKDGTLANIYVNNNREYFLYVYTDNKSIILNIETLESTEELYNQIKNYIDK